MARRKGVPKWATDLLVQLGCSAHVGGKPLCLHKAPNVCGLKNLAYFQGKIILGMKETKREQSKRREEKLASALILASL